MKIDEWFKDIFREASNIAMSHAVTSLSQMIGGPIEMEPPEVKILSRVEFLKHLLQNRISSSFVVGFDITEGLRGLAILQFPERSAINLSATLMGMDPSGVQELDDMGRSAVTEVGNILISVYTDILAKLLGEPVSLSPPKAIASLYDVERELNRPDLRNVENIMLFKTRFYEENVGFESYFYLVPDEKSFEKLVTKLEEQVRETGGGEGGV
ncbi:chemotaxis protein CheC [Thermococcus zilligii]|uniref:chemotaxis protein CheC n=1 Tax=Thermococcus zilligii TaxID=54076 RepID=UPI00029A9619|nr:chemotaxis protein CheC [Thermococcus zilligii]